MDDIIIKELEKVYELDSVEDERLRNWIIRLLLTYAGDYDEGSMVEFDEGVAYPIDRVQRWANAYISLGQSPKAIIERIAEKIVQGLMFDENEEAMVDMFKEFTEKMKDMGAVSTQGGDAFAHPTFGDRPTRPKQKDDVEKVATKDKAKFVRRAKQILERLPEKASDKAKVPALVEWIWTNYAETRRVDGQSVIRRIADTLNVPVSDAGKAFKEIKEYIKELEELEKVLKMMKEIKKTLEEIRKPNDLRPPRQWFERCVERTGSERLCAWVYWHWLKPTGGKDDDSATREARQRKRQWLSERSKD